MFFFIKISLYRIIYQSLYRILYRSLRFCLSLFSFLLPPKIREIISDRKALNIKWRTLPKNKPIWFHCASGEIEYIKPLLRKFKQEQPEQSLFLTYFSPSGKPMAERTVFQTLEADGFAPLPWDEPACLQNFLQELNPAYLIISRTDLWPELLWQSRKKNIPTALVAATFAPGSKKLSALGKIFLSLSLPLLNKICVVSEADKKMASSLFPHLEFLVTGDPRFDQVAYRMTYQQKELPHVLSQWIKDSPVWIAGSTWPEDEAILIPTIQYWKGQSLKLIIVPHETDQQHLQLLMDRLSAANLTYEFYSKLILTINSATQILIYDQKGYLLDLYRLAHFAFIGGSFKKQVHSVMEALGQGCLVMVGPHHLNNREAIEFQNIRLDKEALVRPSALVQPSASVRPSVSAALAAPVPELPSVSTLMPESAFTTQSDSQLIPTSPLKAASAASAAPIADQLALVSCVHNSQEMIQQIKMQLQFIQSVSAVNSTPAVIATFQFGSLKIDLIQAANLRLKVKEKFNTRIGGTELTCRSILPIPTIPSITS